MKKRPLLIVELKRENDELETKYENEFLKNLKNAVLLSLLKDNKIMQWQYERCLKTLAAQWTSDKI